MIGQGDPPILRLLREIEERNFGPIENLDQGEDIPDSDLLNGFLEGYNEPEKPIHFRQNQLKSICIVFLVATVCILLHHIKNTLNPYE